MTPKHTLTLTAYLQSAKAPSTTMLMATTGQRRIVGAAAGRGCAEGYQRPPLHDTGKSVGTNWDALEECLDDLEWLPAKGYILLITERGVYCPTMEEYETFLEILRDAGEAWGNRQAGMGIQRTTSFHVLFPESEQEKAKRAHRG